MSDGALIVASAASGGAARDGAAAVGSAAVGSADREDTAVTALGERTTGGLAAVVGETARGGRGTAGAAVAGGMGSGAETAGGASSNDSEDGQARIPITKARPRTAADAPAATMARLDGRSWTGTATGFGTGGRDEGTGTGA
jgi:hypothetical protein